MPTTQRYINVNTSEKISNLSAEIEILHRNVFDLQCQLHSAYIRINELTQMIQERYDSHSDSQRETASS